MRPKKHGMPMTVLIINTKREMIAKVERGQKMADVARQYGLNRNRPQQIFNCEETGLFWKRMPNRTYITKVEKSVPGHKPMKDRLTLLWGANASGDGGDQGDTPEIMDEILTTDRDLELEVNEDDIEELKMRHEDELTTEEL
ncbi:tigger transposable element-derived protein 1 [Trichonephila clavipes]|nr:tigger transposable element-derived protein 1 [Trichonephila clavipes]